MTSRAKLFVMAALSAGFAMVPAIGSQGAGALGESRSRADSQLLGTSHSPAVLDAAGYLAEARVAEIVSR